MTLAQAAFRMARQLLRLAYTTCEPHLDHQLHTIVIEHFTSLIRALGQLAIEGVLQPDPQPSLDPPRRPNHR